MVPAIMSGKKIGQVMNLVILHEDTQTSQSSDNGLLRFALSSHPVADAVLEGLAKWPWPTGNHNETMIMYPKSWDLKNFAGGNRTIPYADNIPVSPQSLQKAEKRNWICISNGRFAADVAPERIEKMLTAVQADFIAVNVTEELMAYNEKARITAQGRLIGFRRLYFDSFEAIPVSDDWPHCLFIKNSAIEKVMNDSGLPRSFPDLLARCKSASLRVVSFKIAGKVLDLETEDGLLDFCSAALDSTVSVYQKGTIEPNNPRFFGRVLLGKNVRIGNKAVIAGPVIISDNVIVGDGVVITSSVIGPNVSISSEQVVQNRIIRDIANDSVFLRGQEQGRNRNMIGRKIQNNTFRVWPGFSYAGFFKRIVDITAASVAILLFTPFFPVIAAAIKLSSPGPLFYKDKRQGLHGREFDCIKFRTMIVGADDLQDKLRALNQVDGPQFKMDDDPRVSSVGRFLRATYIDEVPQFINVLLGQMSVIGPRPSPEAENELCPFWRYARLSVRPGITGLWQVYGTREQLRDFQEWIHYDVKYVKELSPKHDVWICYKTVRKIVKRFIHQL
jgi:lipopolysaccharide/colanic/teichoic acid biosynthesis glycosyltransferase